MSLIAGLDSPLERGTGLFDWNVGLDYLTGAWDWTETRDWNVITRQ